MRLSPSHSTQSRTRHHIEYRRLHSASSRYAEAYGVFVEVLRDLFLAISANGEAHLVNLSQSASGLSKLIVLKDGYESKSVVACVLIEDYLLCAGEWFRAHLRRRDGAKNRTRAYIGVVRAVVATLEHIRDVCLYTARQRGRVVSLDCRRIFFLFTEHVACFLIGTLCWHSIC